MPPSNQSGSPNLAGILVLDKPARMSSMTAVAIVRRRAGGVKTGHAGTLDPLATGVLVIALGQATKFIDRLMATDKRYETTIDLSAFTTTDDLEGTRTEVALHTPPTEAQMRAAVAQFEGETLQRPPAFSAVKIEGRRAYKSARRGQVVEIPARPVVVHAIDLVRYHWPVVDLRIHCAKGFYVRSLARELGAKLGTGGHCAAIRRTAVGPFTLESAKALDDLPESIAQTDLISIADMLDLVQAGETSAPNP